MEASTSDGLLQTVLFGNVSQRPFSNNLSGIVRAFSRATRLQVIEPARFTGFVSTGGASPAAVPEAAAREALAGPTPELVICLAGALHVTADLRRLFPPRTVFIGFAASDPIGLSASLAIAGDFDLFYTQDPHSLPVYRRRGFAARAYLPAVDTGEYVPLAREKEWDVAFVGKWTPYRDRLLHALSPRVALRVFTYDGEGRWSVPAEPALNSPEEVCEAMARSRLALECALVDEEAAGELSGSVRLTNRPQVAAACGVPSLVEAFDLLPRFFEPGSEIETYDGPDDLVAKALELLADPARRESMGRRAMERVRRDHTWERRVAAFLADVGDLRAARAAGA